MRIYMKTIKSIFTVLVIAISGILIANAQPLKGKPWEIPVKYKDLKNDVKPSPASIQAGETLYKKNCASCHGKTGLGDGPKAKTLDTFSGDLSGKDFQDQSDGTIFYQTKFGRNEMPKYDKKIEDADIWNLINYMRTLKK